MKEIFFWPLRRMASFSSWTAAGWDYWVKLLPAGPLFLTKALCVNLWFHITPAHYDWIVTWIKASLFSQALCLMLIVSIKHTRRYAIPVVHLWIFISDENKIWKYICFLCTGQEFLLLFNFLFSLFYHLLSSFASLPLFLFALTSAARHRLCELTALILRQGEGTDLLNH